MTGKATCWPCDGLKHFVGKLLRAPRHPQVFNKTHTHTHTHTHTYIYIYIYLSMQNERKCVADKHIWTQVMHVNLHKFTVILFSI